jgi:glutamate-1-semialdehyde aminotransferase
MKTWDERAEVSIAQGCLTYSRRSDQFVKGVYPTHITKAEGCTLYDENGKGYIDFICGLGSNIIGSNNNFSIPTIYEVELAEKIKEKITFIDKLRFLKTGSEACLAAVRIARAYTSHHLVFGIGYHGFGNMFIAEEDPGTGTVPELYKKFDGILELMYAIDNNHEMNDVGAVIIEPVQLDFNVKPLLVKLRKKCDEKKIVLIFDEVITGFRTPRYCMAQYLDVMPDIICLGKAIANGYPLAVVGGRKEVMDAPGWFVSSTFAGELSAINQAMSTIDFLTEARLNDLWTAGAWFQKEFNKLTPKLQMVGIPTKAVFCGDELFKNLFWQEMCKRGYLMGKAWHIMWAHIDNPYPDASPYVLENALITCKEVINHIEHSSVKLEGQMAQEVFKRY